MVDPKHLGSRASRPQYQHILKSLCWRVPAHGMTSCRAVAQLRQLIQSTSRGAKLWRDACSVFERLLHKQGPALGECPIPAYTR